MLIGIYKSRTEKILQLWCKEDGQLPLNKIKNSQKLQKNSLSIAFNDTHAKKPQNKLELIINILNIKSVFTVDKWSHSDNIAHFRYIYLQNQENRYTNLDNMGQWNILRLKDIIYTELQKRRKSTTKSNTKITSMEKRI